MLSRTHVRESPPSPEKDDAPRKTAAFFPSSPVAAAAGSSRPRPGSQQREVGTVSNSHSNSSSSSTIRGPADLWEPDEDEVRALAMRDFDVIGVLGVGTYGVVKLARHVASGASVALKVLSKEHVVAARENADRVPRDAAVADHARHAQARAGRECGAAGATRRRRERASAAHPAARVAEPPAQPQLSGGARDAPGRQEPRPAAQRPRRPPRGPRSLLLGKTPFYHENPREQGRKITTEPVVFPGDFAREHPEASDLICKLLVKRPAERLGSMRELKSHAFFTRYFPGGSTSWEALERRERPAPFVPKLAGPFDTSFFEALDGAAQDELEGSVEPYYEDGSHIFSAF
ncbi:hypothetical protein PybrP1_010104 [[Pythium] brassicae (nom. inval.)]|nr:hypothetical protein PybrP1_010104 [[Pythium] brassicae (nom. inval.)]